MNVNEEMGNLKEMLQTEEDLDAIFQKFMSLVDSRKFMEMGKQKANKLLKTFIKKATQDLGISQCRDIKFKYLRGFNFYRGSFFADIMPGMVMYFSDIKVGLITLPRDFSGNTSYVRFTGSEVDAGSFTISNPPETTQ